MDTERLCHGHGSRTSDIAMDTGLPASKPGLPASKQSLPASGACQRKQIKECICSLLVLWSSLFPLLAFVG
jgi:hypothetical protein